MWSIISFLSIGTLSTILDWTIFYILIRVFNMQYPIALCFTFLVVMWFHLTGNKHFTFQFKTKKIKTQFSIYISVIFISLLFNLIIMWLLINEFFMSKVISRIIATIIMVGPNYLLHKYLSFNGRLINKLG